MNQPDTQPTIVAQAQPGGAGHLAIYRRWRAQTFAQIVGQEPIVETLRNAVRLDKVAHAILFVGPRGTGKTSLARILAKALNCTDLRDGDPCDRCPSCVSIREGTTLDVIEIDAASNRGINEVKELRDRLNYAPSLLRRKVYILDEAHQITKDAWNALLKSLEEPPEFVVFMFASTHPQDFPPAILSRLQRYDVRRLTVPEIEGKLGRILEAEAHVAEPEAVSLIARLAAGGMRDAESMLDQLIASAPAGLTAARVRELLGLAEADAVDGFIDALVGGDARTGIALLDALEERGRDLRGFLDQIVDALREGIGAALADTANTSSRPAETRHDVGALAAVARRLTQIDPNRAGIGGLRLQLELALLTGPAATAAVPSTTTTRAQAVSTTTRAQAVSQEAPAPGPAPAPVREGTAAPTGAPAAPPSNPSHQPASPPRPRKSATQSPNASRPGSPPVEAAPVEVPAVGTPPATELPLPDDDLARLRSLWSDIVTDISKHPPTKPLISVCRPISVEGAIVTLGFPENQTFLREVATRRGPILEEGIGRYLGHEVSVRCVATNLDLLPPLPADADVEFVLSEARRIFEDDLVDVGEVT